MSPLVSIIIPTYNRANLIGETLNSILVQTYENWECIIVDDGSTDNTDEVVSDYIKKDSRFQYHHRPKHRPKGGNAARNYGFELSKGEYVNWFDSDDIMLEDFILKKISLFSSEEVQLVICSGIYVDGKLRKIENIDLNIDSFLFKDYVRWKLKIMTPSILFKKSFLENKALFDLKIFRGQETEFFSRLFYCLPENNYKIINIPLFLYRQHASTKSFENHEYVKIFKESQTKIMIENFKKSIALQDSDLIKSYYSDIIAFFFKGLENRHTKNCVFIVKNASNLFFLIDKKLAIQFWFSSWFCIIIKRNIYTVEKYFKNFPLV
ncbi:glycosyltransferase family 2 protein [Flavobacterium hydatis]|uniref:Glycosyltransferase 2-like domain-containing protein n=1 Tax=Flavobacterium hydatis TaxID=991 RepID=A0ABX4CLV9_FLAHY|nr:glycosyltransferase family 2 protein [Flavobacterium hydatis]OXA96994.1 hypothetical protein B0A62_07020 [Flavobacterium hydatis]